MGGIRPNVPGQTPLLLNDVRPCLTCADGWQRRERRVCEDDVPLLDQGKKHILPGHVHAVRIERAVCGE